MDPFTALRAAFTHLATLLLAAVLTAAAVGADTPDRWRAAHAAGKGPVAWIEAADTAAPVQLAVLCRGASVALVVRSALPIPASTVNLLTLDIDGTTFRLPGRRLGTDSGSFVTQPAEDLLSALRRGHVVTLRGAAGTMVALTLRGADAAIDLATPTCAPAPARGA
ncbi:hypothetical protein [Meridianimarinicoccus roseus]|nr:hypothetical protein [Meridianimarinicoccus roseus]